MILTKRQRQILDFLREFLGRHGYAPSLEEIGRHFRLSSLATVHKHLVNLERKGLIRRDRNRSRAVELLPEKSRTPAAVEVPLLGLVAAGRPIQAIPQEESMALPAELVGRGQVYVLRVKGDSMIEEHIQDMDYIIVEDRRRVENGEMVIALLHGEEVTLKKFYREDGWIRLQPANPGLAPMRLREEEIQIQGVVVGVIRKYR